MTNAKKVLLDPRNVLFIYSKGSYLKVFNLDKDKIVRNTMLKNGWIHTNTIDPCSFIEYLANNDDDEDILITVKELLQSCK